MRLANANLFFGGLTGLTSVLESDSDGEGANWHMPQRTDAVHCIGWNGDQISRSDLPLFIADRHNSSAANDVVEFEGVVAVWVELGTWFDFELTYEFDEAAYRCLLKLLLLVEPPHRACSKVLDDGFHAFA